MNTLTLDDMESSVRLMLKTLRKIDPGGEHIGTTQYDEALRLATEKTEIAFLDVEMPGKTGFEVARLLKEKYPALHIIIISGEIGYRRQAQQMSYIFLLKPVLEEDITECLKALNIQSKAI